MSSKATKQIRMDQLVSKQFQLWKRSYDSGEISPKKRTPCITISRQIGSGGVELAERLAKRLGWKAFDKDLVEYIAENAHVRKSMVEMFDDRVQNEMDDWVVTLLDRFALGSYRYFKHLIIVMLGIAEHGHAIILGRGGNFILPADRTLQLRVVVPFEQRVRHVSAERKLSLAEAKKAVRSADQERQKFIKRFFHRDSEDPTDYDLVLNMSSLSLSAAEAITLEALRAKFPELTHV